MGGVTSPKSMTHPSSPLIFDDSDGQQLKINTIGSWLKREFGRKIIKLSIDGGFTCPNRDGSKGTGGCLFCSESGSGDMSSSIDRGILEAMDDQITLLSDKWPKAGYMAYFQNHSNTYAPGEYLEDLYSSALTHPDVVGLAIATRPDCIDEDVVDLLSGFNKRTFLWVELGLQSIHEKTMVDMNLCYSLKDYDRALRMLSDAGIRTVTHLILGLPGESRDQMLQSLEYICRPLKASVEDISRPSRPSQDHIFGLKLHMLNVMKNSPLPLSYPGYVPFETMDGYTDLIVDCIERIPPDITIHRIAGDAPRPVLIAPEWSWKKRSILNQIHLKLNERDTWQGRLVQE